MVNGVGADRRPYNPESGVTRRPSEAQSHAADAHPPAWVIAAAGTAGASVLGAPKARWQGLPPPLISFARDARDLLDRLRWSGRGMIERRDYIRGSSMANSFTGRKRVRKSFGRIAAAVDMPNLIEVQKS